MKNKLSTNLFYVYNIIFYTFLLSSPLSASTQLLLNQKEEPQQYKSLQFNVIEYKEEEEEKEKEINKDKEWFKAAKKGQLEIAKKLKQQGANPQATDKDGYNALHLACFSSSVDMVTWLLDECKIGIKTKGFYKKTPFLCAAEKGQLAIAKLLKQRGASIKAKDHGKNNALHLACRFSDNVSMVTWLLNVCKIGIESEGQFKNTPFLYAAEKGQLTIAKLLKNQGANLNAKNECGSNALHLACLNSNNKALVTWLLDECKIDKESKNKKQKTPFLRAAEGGQLEIAKLLKKRSVDINATSKFRENALHLACRWSGSVDMVTWLLDVCDIKIEAKEKCDKTTPFLCTAEGGQLEIAKLLRQRGANLNVKDAYQDNALHFACLYSSSVPMVTWLLDVCKIDIESKGQYKRTPFLCAAKKGQLEIAKLLKQKDANINVTSKFGNNALHLACMKSGNVEMVTWLLDECKIDIESKGKKQKTPFLCAVEKGQLEIAKLLKDQGANIDKKTALPLAKESKNKNVINYIKEVTNKKKRKKKKKKKKFIGWLVSVRT